MIEKTKFLVIFFLLKITLNSDLPLHPRPLKPFFSAAVFLEFLLVLAEGLGYMGTDLEDKQIV